jgi:hypothetical protein
MGTYVYKISRKGKKVEGAPTFDGKIYEAEFAYKSGWDDDRLHTKYVAPTVRAWKKALFNVFFDDSVIDRVRFVMDWEDGAPVYRSNSVSWYDSKEREIVGYLRMDGETGKFRFDDNMRNQRIIDTNTLTNALGEKVNLPRRHLDV